MLSMIKGGFRSARPGGRMKTIPQETEEEKAKERKALGMAGGGRRP